MTNVSDISGGMMGVETTESVVSTTENVFEGPKEGGLDRTESLTVRTAGVDASAWTTVRLRRLHETLRSRDATPAKPAASRIVGVEFSILSEDVVLKQSRVCVTHGSAWDRGEPRANGLSSLLMAPSDRNTSCNTCGRSIEDCPGHPGHVKLAAPIYIPGYLDSVLRVLKCVCFFCAEPLFDPARAEEAASSGNWLQRDKMLARAAKKVCRNPMCEAPQPKFVKDAQKLAIHVEWSPAAADLLENGAESEWARRPFTPYRAKQILSNVSDATLELMGMVPGKSHIKDAIFDKMPIPPPPVRPSGPATDGNSGNGRGRGSDDLTNKLHEIMKRNKTLEEHFRKQEEKNGRPCDPDDLDSTALDLLSDLQLEFASYVDDRYEGKARGKIPGQAMGGAKRPKKSIKQRLSGKQGRIRGNLLGKRVDFAARTVVVPDPNLALDEVGVPESIALGITKNVVVNPHNLEDLSECVALGKDVLGGAETVTTETGQRIHLDRALSRPVLLPGMTVQRYLRDGDLVIVNRQPSLHRPSMMGHRIKIYLGMDRHPFGLNLSATAPYNADFDGDEMNMHVPQNVEAEAEVAELMGANRQIVSGQSSAPVMGLVHDGALGAYLLSLPDAYLTASEVGDLAVEAGFGTDRLGEPAILKPRKLWTGKQVLSAVLPSDFRFQKTVGSHDPERSVRPDSETYPSRYRVVKFLVPPGSSVREGQSLAKICLLLDPADSGDEGPVVEIETEVRAPRDSCCFKGLVLPGDVSRCGVSPLGELFDADGDDSNAGKTPVHVGVLGECFVGEGDGISAIGVREQAVAVLRFGDYLVPIRTKLVGSVSSVKIAAGSPVPPSAIVLDVKVDGPYDADLSHHSIDICDGKFLRGFLARTGASVGRSPNSIVHVLALTRGSQAAADFLGAIQRVCNRWFLGRGFSVGLKDVVPGAKAARKAKRAIERVESSVNNIYEEAEREGFDPSKIETTVRNMLRGVVDAVGVEVSDEIPSNNHIVLMKDAGSKGNTINLVQMMFCTGQQIVEGVRPSAKDPWSSILSCFQGGDNAPHARAFVKAALSQGLSFSEFFFYCMAGREGLCDTAVKTATTGYIERRLLKSMESLFFAHDGRVRNSLNQIVQDNFGDGGWDPAKLRKQSLELLRKNDLDLLRHLEGDRLKLPYQLDSELQTLRAISRRRSEILASGGRVDASLPDPQTGLLLAPEPEWCRLKRLRDDCRACRLSGITPSLDSDVYLPFLSRDVVSECELVARRRSQVAGRTRDANLHRICDPKVALKIVRANSERLRAQGFSALAVRLAFEGCFTVRRICREWKLSERELRIQIDKVATACEYARTDPGEMVGCVAAQSIGEPAQQMTLNSVAPWEKIVLHDAQTGQTRVERIGTWIDGMLVDADPEFLDFVPQNRTECLTLKDSRTSVFTCDYDGNTSWGKITAVTRHLPPGGELYKFATESGRSITVARTKSVLVWNSQTSKFEHRDATDVKVGDSLPLAHRIPDPFFGSASEDSHPWKLDYHFGYVVGAYLASGHASAHWVDFSVGKSLEAKQTLLHWRQTTSSLGQVINPIPKSRLYRSTLSVGNHRSKTCLMRFYDKQLSSWLRTHAGRHGSEKRLPDLAFASAREFGEGVITALHLLSGNMRRTLCGMQAVAFVRNKFPNKQVADPIESVSFLLARFGIATKIRTLRPNSSKRELIVEPGSVYDYMDILRTRKWWWLRKDQPLERRNLDSSSLRNDVRLDKVSRIEILPPTSYVYDLTVPSTTNFGLLNGLVTADTFHNLASNTKNVSLGIPRLKKLIETKTKDKSATVFLKEPFNRSERAATNLLKAIQCTTLKSVYALSSVEHEPINAPIASPPEDEPVRRLHAEIALPEERRTTGKSAYVVRFLLHKRAMLERNLTPLDVGEAISRFLVGWGTDIQCSDANMNTWVVRVRLHATANEASTFEKESEGVQDSTDAQTTDSETALSVDKAMNEALEAELVKKVQISGITGITGGSVREIDVDCPDANTGDLKRRKEWVVDTEGTALERLLALEFVDPTRTFSNDVTEVEEVFGIEAAAAVLFHELKQVIYFGGTYIDPRWILLLSHTMTHLGYQVALSRFGINRLETGPLVKMSFEQTYEVVTQAAVQAKIDAVQGPTPSVMMGQLGPLPTGVVEVRPTREYLQKVAEWQDPAVGGSKRSGQLMVSVPRERPRRVPRVAKEPDAVCIMRGPDVSEADTFVRKKAEVRFEDEKARLESSAPAAPERREDRKRPRPIKPSAFVATLKLPDRPEELRVREDAESWPAPERFRLFRSWAEGAWTPLGARKIAV